MEIREPGSVRTSPRSVKSPRFIFNNYDESMMPEIVLSITNGMPIEQVHPKIYQNLLPYLEVKRNNLIRDHNAYSVNLVNTALEGINNYFIQRDEQIRKEEEERAAKDLTLEEYEEKLARQEEARKNAQQFTREEIDTSIQCALNCQYDQIDPRIVDILGTELRKLQRAAIKNGEYNDAGRYHNAARQVGMMSTGIRYEELTAGQVNDLESKVTNATIDLSQTKRLWKEKIDEAKKQKEKEMKRFQNEAERNLKEFDKLYSEAEEEGIGSIPQQYCKYTNKVSELKKKEEYLVSSKRFVEAAEMREEVERQKRTEEETFVKKYHEDLDVKRAEYVRKMKEKMKVLDEKANQEISLLEIESRRQISQARKALRRFEIQSQQQATTVIALQMPESARSSRRRSDSGNSPKKTTTSGYYKNGNNNNNNSSFNNFGNNNDSNNSNNNNNNGNSNNNSAVNNNSLRNSAVSSRRNQFPNSQERNSAELFRQRRAINAVLYTRTQSARLPRIDKR